MTYRFFLQITNSINVTDFKYVIYQTKNFQIKILVILFTLFSSSLNAQYSEAIMKQDSIIKAKYDNYDRAISNRRKALDKQQSSWLQNNEFYIIDYYWDNEKINLHLDKALNKNASSKAFLKGAIPTLVLGGIFQYLDRAHKVRGNNTLYRKFYAATGGLLLASFLSNAAGISDIKKAKRIRDKELDLSGR